MPVPMDSSQADTHTYHTRAFWCFRDQHTQAFSITVAPGIESNNIPTLSEWALILMALMILTQAVRRFQTQPV